MLTEISIRMSGPRDEAVEGTGKAGNWGNCKGVFVRIFSPNLGILNQDWRHERKRISSFDYESSSSEIWNTSVSVKSVWGGNAQNIVCAARHRNTSYSLLRHFFTRPSIYKLFIFIFSFRIVASRMNKD